MDDEQTVIVKSWILLKATIDRKLSRAMIYYVLILENNSCDLILKIDCSIEKY